MSAVISTSRPALPVKTIFVVATMAVGAFLGGWLKPTKLLADTLPSIELDKHLPAKFNDWQVDRSIPTVLPDPESQALLSKIYNQTVSRTYVNPSGDHIMLSVAYGKLQADDTLQLHNPEICYSAQGFTISNLHRSSMTVKGQPLAVHQLQANMPGRPEVVSYWVVIGDKVANTRTDQKVVKLKYALQGYLSDGMLMRVSSIDSDPQHAYRLHERFANDLASSMDNTVRPRYFGL